MKLIIQIPCYNEEDSLPLTLRDLPTSIAGIDEIEILIIDDGSTDRTVEVARESGAHHFTGFPRNRGLAKAFALGLNTSLALGADIIVNTDADNQYCGEDIPKLVEPLLRGEADLVIGDRQTQSIGHFSGVKKFFQKHGSFLVGQISSLDVPDAVSGFRAMTRQAALELNVISTFSYTLETLIQAGRKKLAVVSVPIRTNEQLRESRLFKSMSSFLRRSGSTMIRVYTTHEPLKIFLTAALLFFLCATVPFARFLYFFLRGDAGGHIQSIIFGLALLFTSGFLATVGILSELISSNRKLIEEALRIIRDQQKRE
jgi:glycosyltransferase involved in cell wall biosynthesis